MATKVLIIPSAYKQGTLYSIIPESATKDLKVRRKLSLEGYVAEIPEPTANLILNSDNFSDYWFAYPYEVIDDILDLPLGLNVGVLYIETDFGYADYNYIGYAVNNSIISNQDYTFSMYVLRGDVRFFCMSFTEFYNIGGSVGVEFDLELNSYQNYGTGDFNFISANIESVGNDWYRLSFTFNSTIDIGPSNSSIYVLPGNGSGLNPSDYGVQMFQGRDYTFGLSSPQLELGNVATTYASGIDISGLVLTPPYEGNATRINSEGILEMVDLDVPRLDYSTGDCPSILIEQQRTNRMPKSNNFDIWSGGSATITSNNALSPENINNASTVYFSSSSGYIYSPIISRTTGIISMWLRSPSGPTDVTLNNSSRSTGSVTFNLTEEWVRYETVKSNISRLYLRPTVSDTTIEIYGVQVEFANQYNTATSYIYTNNDKALYSEWDQIYLEDLTGITKITETYLDGSTNIWENITGPYYLPSGIKLVKME